MKDLLYILHDDLFCEYIKIEIGGGQLFMKRSLLINLCCNGRVHSQYFAITTCRKIPLVFRRWYS